MKPVFIHVGYCKVPQNQFAETQKPEINSKNKSKY
jgi:hypothetical protein